MNELEWHAKVDELWSHTWRYSIRRGDEVVSFADALSGWRSSPEFRAFFLSQLADAPFEAYFWEMPPVTAATVGQPFEFVLVDSPELAIVTPDPSAFAAHFGAGVDREIVAFPNLGYDAWLLAPCPRGERAVYPHLAAFARGAPESQQHALWRELAVAVEAHLGEQLLWLSTAGLGVFWLHVRLDTQPKYYHHAPYKQA